ncbi:hypothetical protein LINPERHAP1_LOCUS25931 [Linum perenne]
MARFYHRMGVRQPEVSIGMSSSVV